MLIRPTKRRKRQSVRSKKLHASLTTLSVLFELRSCLALKKLMIPRSKMTALDMSKMFLKKPRGRRLSGRKMSRKRHHSGTAQSSTTRPSLSRQLWQRGQESTKNFAEKKTSEQSLRPRRESFPERESVSQTRLDVLRKQRSLQRRPKPTGRLKWSVKGKRKNEGSAKRNWRRKNVCVWRNKEKESRGNVLNVPNLHQRREEAISTSPHPVGAGAAAGEEVEEGHHLTVAVVMAEVVTKAAIVQEAAPQIADGLRQEVTQSNSLLGNHSSL
mmetsp:Transcript_1976/g.3353  ORF Transcript_1976/g.3353 Transcript_1976/m.3353 type:complete len:271 (-) Transcript_1976:8-820(-)